MALELVGTLQQILPEITGQGKNGTWAKQEFIVETQDTYPKKVCLSAWGNQIGELSKFAAGDLLTVSLNLESREYNGRWFTEARAWRFQFGAAESSAPSAEKPRASNTPASSPKPSALPDAALTSFEESDDLPF